MITKILTALIFLASMVALKAYHPINIAIALLFISALIISQISWSSQNSVLPQIYFIIFAGGILVIIIILAALTPNQNSNRAKKVATILLLMVCFTPSQQAISPNLSCTTFVSTIMNQSENFMFLVITVLYYFIGIMAVLDTINNAIRTFH